MAPAGGTTVAVFLPTGPGVTAAPDVADNGPRLLPQLVLAKPTSLLTDSYAPPKKTWRALRTRFASMSKGVNVTSGRGESQECTAKVGRG